MTVRVVPKTLVIQVTIPNGQAANSILTASIIDDPTIGAQGYLQVPVNAAMVIEDVYVKKEPDIDVELTFVKNDVKTLAKTPPVSTLLVSNPSRPRVPPMIYDGGDKLSIKAVNLDANATGADVTVTVYADVKMFIED